MADPPRYRSDLYHGTADYYDAFRPTYPSALIDHITAAVPLSATSTVLDLACGTGQIACALADRVGRVVAADQEPDFVTFGAAKCEDLGITNVEWRVASAETLASDHQFSLVAVGNAFHRFDRDVAASTIGGVLHPLGCVALLWTDTPWVGDHPWQRALAELVNRWTAMAGAPGRARDDWAEPIEQRPHASVLADAGFIVEGRTEHSTSKTWDIASLIGFIHSTSLLNHAVLGDRAAEFEAEVRATLLEHNPEGRFDQQLSAACDIARRPG